MGLWALRTRASMSSSESPYQLMARPRETSSAGAYTYYIFLQSYSTRKAVLYVCVRVGSITSIEEQQTHLVQKGSGSGYTAVYIATIPHRMRIQVYFLLSHVSLCHMFSSGPRLWWAIHQWANETCRMRNTMPMQMLTVVPHLACSPSP